MHAVEHSGQLSGTLREQIEQQFNRHGINVLVCTPTLELGVDLPDLVALLMRNIPPTPANYAQRAGRAGRERRIALVVSHAGTGPHDSYFFNDPAEMITGLIRPPVLMLDNPVVVRRHIHSLILENLSTAVPPRWEAITSEDGTYTGTLEEDFGDELADPGSESPDQRFGRPRFRRRSSALAKTTNMLKGSSTASRPRWSVDCECGARSSRH